MTLIGFLLFLLCFIVGASLAYWVIKKFLPEPAQMIALAITGVILLIVLVLVFLPDVGNYRVFR